MHRAVEPAWTPARYLRRAQQHRRMAVMAAGMHLAGVFGLVVDIVLFLDIERVHIGAEADGRAVALVAAQRADHAGPREAAMHLDAEFMQPQGDVIGRLVFLERGFRVPVDMLPPRGHFILEFGDAVDDRHGRVSVFGPESVGAVSAGFIAWFGKAQYVIPGQIQCHPRGGGNDGMGGATQAFPRPSS